MSALPCYAAILIYNKQKFLKRFLLKLELTDVFQPYWITVINVHSFRWIYILSIRNRINKIAASSVLLKCRNTVFTYKDIQWQTVQSTYYMRVLIFKLNFVEVVYLSSLITCLRELYFTRPVTVAERFKA
jgi:hypothetical protein